MSALTHDEIYDGAYDKGYGQGYRDAGYVARVAAGDCYTQGVCDTLRLVYIGAACAEVLYARLAFRTPSNLVPCVLQYVASTHAAATLHALADLGDEIAREMLR
jgi:hypothetical protein